jgi:selenocysteine-specific elongation factor
MGIVLGTAGHIDHGKTALIKALTGVDTDRLKEEKDRGISIDLGFTHLDLPGVGVNLGVVDVPGHERFVKNMLAGAGGIDLVLLVVACDEGVMPQTREHLDICVLLGIPKAVVAMTKADMADPELAEAAVADVQDLLAGTPYNGCPIVKVSSTTREGLDELRDALEDTVRDIAVQRPGGAFRMPVDRSFVMEGFGTVVTGTTWSGSVKTGDHLEILPSRLKTRIRGIQVHGSVVEEVGPGVRSAIALHGLSKSDVGRGDWAVTPDSFTPSHMLDVRLNLTKGAGKPLRSRARVRFHLGASEIMGRVVLLEGEELSASESAMAQFRLEEPAVAAKGDKFVIRSYSPSHTLGGGVVILPVARKHKSRDRDVVESLQRQVSGEPQADITEVIARSGMDGASLEVLSRQMGLELKTLEQIAKEQKDSGALVSVGGDRYVSAEVYAEATDLISGWIKEYQDRFPLRWGFPKGELKSRAKGKRIGSELFEAVLEKLRSEGRLYTKGDRARLDSPAPAIEGAVKDGLDRIEATYRDAGNSPPTLKELTSLMEGKAAGVGQLSEALEFLCMKGALVKVTADMCFHADALERIRALVAGHFQNDDRLAVPAFKDLVGASRKYAVPLLEYLDRIGVTRRVGDVRAPGRQLR